MKRVAKENNYGFSNNEYLYLLAKLIRFEVKEYYGEKIIINNKLEEEYFLPSKLLIIQHKDYNYHFLLTLKLKSSGQFELQNHFCEQGNSTKRMGCS